MVTSVQLLSLSRQELAQIKTNLCKSVQLNMEPTSYLKSFLRFRYVVDWGDGAETKGQESGIGPFQVEHQYALKAASYQVNVKFCSQGDGCCDSLSKIISVPANSSSEAL